MNEDEDECAMRFDGLVRPHYIPVVDEVKNMISKAIKDLAQQNPTVKLQRKQRKIYKYYFKI